MAFRRLTAAALYIFRKGGMNRLIKIYHKAGKYGFSEPYEFDSVPALIDYFSSSHSLAEYNPDLDITLREPVKRDMDRSMDDNEILRRLGEINIEYQHEINEFEALAEQQGKTAQELQNLFQAFDSFKELMKVFEEQRQLLVRNQQAHSQHHIKSVHV